MELLSLREESFRKERVVTWVKTVKVVDGDRKKTFRFPNKEVSENFPGGSDSQESVYNASDLGSSPGLGRSPGEGNGYPL